MVINFSSGFADFLYAISQFDPVAELSTVAKIATFIAFFSATQDIVLDAYRREILTDNELGLGTPSTLMLIALQA